MIKLCRPTDWLIDCKLYLLAFKMNNLSDVLKLWIYSKYGYYVNVNNKSKKCSRLRMNLFIKIKINKNFGYNFTIFQF